MNARLPTLTHVIAAGCLLCWMAPVGHRLRAADDRGAAAGAAPPPAQAATAKAAEAPFLSRLENEVIKELNLVRTEPPKYAEFLKQYRRQFSNNLEMKGKGNMIIRTTEGVKAVDEAIAFLRTATPLPALTAAAGLSRAAQDHVADTGKKGLRGHDGSDGSTPAKRVERYGQWERAVGENIAYGVTADQARAIVIQLLVDDGVPSRGHRLNIFNADYLTVGVACGAHQTFRLMCVMDFAGGYRDDPRAIASRKKK